MAGRCPASNCTSSTGPMTCAICPTAVYFSVLIVFPSPSQVAGDQWPATRNPTKPSFLTLASNRPTICHSHRKPLESSRKVRRPSSSNLSSAAENISSLPESPPAISRCRRKSLVVCRPKPSAMLAGFGRHTTRDFLRHLDIAGGLSGRDEIFSAADERFELLGRRTLREDSSGLR